MIFPDTHTRLQRTEHRDAVSRASALMMRHEAPAMGSVLLAGPGVKPLGSDGLPSVHRTSAAPVVAEQRAAGCLLCVGLRSPDH